MIEVSYGRTANSICHRREYNVQLFVGSFPDRSSAGVADGGRTFRGLPFTILPRACFERNLFGFEVVFRLSVRDTLLSATFVWVNKAVGMLNIVEKVVKVMVEAVH